MLVPLHKMHATEVDTDISLVARLLKAQFALWADLPIEPVDRLGETTRSIGSAMTWWCDCHVYGLNLAKAEIPAR